MPSIRDSSIGRRVLSVFTEVRPGEAATALILLADVFLILSAYYFVKPVREAWLSGSTVGGLSQIEIKAYSTLAQSLVLAFVLPLYGWFATRWNRKALITRVTLFFIGSFVAFWALRPGGGNELAYSGPLFYVWVGIFSVAIVAQFWAFAADLYSNERGRRLFPLIAVGGSSGGVVGAWAARRAIESGADPFDLILVAAVLLSLALPLARWAEGRGTVVSDAANAPAQTAAPEREDPAAPVAERPNVFALAFGNRYVLAIAAVALLINWVNTNGENILYAAVQSELSEEVTAEGLAAGSEEAQRWVRAGTASFYGGLYFWVNLGSLLLQAFVASRIIRWGGFALLAMVTPIVSLGTYAAIAWIPVLGVIRVMKILENSVNYSLNNTAKHIYWLPAPRQIVYQGKTTVDTFFMRAGDGLAALTVFVGTQVLGFALGGFIAVNLTLVALWCAAAWAAVLQYRRMAATAPG